MKLPAPVSALKFLKKLLVFFMCSNLAQTVLRR
jgi:hypothetical protein